MSEINRLYAIEGREVSRMRANRGLTLIELLIVIMLIAIIGIVAFPRVNLSSTNAAQEARRLLNDIRYVQALSMSTGLRYRWVRSSSTTYQLLNESGTPILLPTGGTTLQLSDGVTLSTTLPSNLLAFDSRGVPYTDASLPGTALSSTATITLSGGGTSVMVQITPQTGYGAIA